MKKVRKGMAIGAGLCAAILLGTAAYFEDLDLNKWSINGVRVTATAAQLNQLAANTLTADLTLEKAELIDNGTAGTVELQTTRTNANFLNVWMSRESATNIIADNDYAEFGMREHNQAPTTTNTPYASWRFVAKDVTKGTEDGAGEGYAYVNGTKTKIVTFDATGFTVHSGTAVLPAHSISAGELDTGIVTNVLSAGMALPAVNYAAATNGNASNLASGTVPAGRIGTYTIDAADIKLADGKLIVGGASGTGVAQTVTGNMSMTDGGIFTATTNVSVNVTNGQTVTIASGINYLRAYKGTNGATDAATVAAPTRAGMVAYIVNTGTTNSLSFAKAGYWKGAAVTLATNEMSVVVSSASAWYSHK